MPVQTFKCMTHCSKFRRFPVILQVSFIVCLAEELTENGVRSSITFSISLFIYCAMNYSLNSKSMSSFSEAVVY